MSVEDSSWGMNVNIGSSCEKLVFLALCAYADADGVTRASQNNIAAITRMTPRTITKHVNRLIAGGFVVKESPAVYHVVGIPGGGATFLEKRYVEVQKSSRWEKLRLSILARDAHQCGYCRKHADTVDHIVPRSRGGADDPSNLVAACRRCNVSKGAKLLSEWGRSDA